MFSAKSLSSIWQEIKEELIIWIKTNKLKLMEQKSINLFLHLNNALGLWIKEKATPLLEEAS